MQGLKSMAFATANAHGAVVARSVGSPVVKPRDVAPARGLITVSALQTLERTRLGRAACEAFRFHGPAESTASARQLMRASIEAMAGARLVRHEATPEGLERQVSTSHTAIKRLIGRSLESEDVTRLCASHGPVKLVLPPLPPARHNQQLPSGSQAVVVLATFAGEDGGRLAVLLDGNDAQRNEVMSALKSWMAARDDERSLSELGPQDFEAFDASRRELGATMRTHQMAFRIVHLDELLAAAKVAPVTRLRNVEGFTSVIDQPPMLLCDRRVLACEPLLSEKEAFSLQAVVRREPFQVERYPLPS